MKRWQPTQSLFTKQAGPVLPLRYSAHPKGAIREILEGVTRDNNKPPYDQLTSERGSSHATHLSQVHKVSALCSTWNWLGGRESCGPVLYVCM